MDGRGDGGADKQTDKQTKRLTDGDGSTCPLTDRQVTHLWYQGWYLTRKPTHHKTPNRNAQLKTPRPDRQTDLRSCQALQERVFQLLERNGVRCHRMPQLRGLLLQVGPLVADNLDRQTQPTRVPVSVYLFLGGSPRDAAAVGFNQPLGDSKSRVWVIRA
jgi:hypothetical protein